MNCVVLRLMGDENKTFIFKTSRKHEFISTKLSIPKPVLIWLRESLSQTKIAKGYGVGANAIKKLMDEYGIDTKSKPKYQKPSKEELLRLYPAKTLEEVGEHYIVGQTLVHKWFDEYGIERTKKNRKPRTAEARANMSKARKNRKPVKLKGRTVGCVICGKEFYLIPARIKQSDKHYCSYECLGKSKVIDHINKDCLYCNSSLTRREGETAGNYRRRTYCNGICATKANPPPTLYGKDNPGWKGEAARRRQSRTGQTAWRKNILKRDNHTCVHCGANDVPVVAHHVLSFEDFPEHRLNEENGITLCNPCHFIEHGWSLSSKGIKSLINEHGIEERRWTGSCLYCDKVVIKRASDMRRSGKANDGSYRTYAFCSYRCSGKARQKAMEGMPKNERKGFSCVTIYEQWQKDKAQD